MEVTGGLEGGAELASHLKYIDMTMPTTRFQRHQHALPPAVLKVLTPMH